jgi:hypothetical protein
MVTNEINRLPDEVGKAIPLEEKIYWTGKPNWKSFGYHAFGIKYFLIYFFVCALYAVSQIESSFSFERLLINYTPYLVSGTLAAMIIFLLAYFSARHTCYVITEKRIVIRTGVALVFLLNMPFKNILSIDMKVLAQGRGNLTFKVRSKKRIPFFSCWPSVKAGVFLEPVPAFRSIMDIEKVGQTISEIALLNREENNPKIEKENSGAAA